MDIRDHRGDPGGREHWHGFSLAFGFSDSIPRKKLERRRDGEVSGGGSTASFFECGLSH